MGEPGLCEVSAKSGCKKTLDLTKRKPGRPKGSKTKPSKLKRNKQAHSKATGGGESMDTMKTSGPGPMASLDTSDAEQPKTPGSIQDVGISLLRDSSAGASLRKPAPQPSPEAAEIKDICDGVCQYIQVLQVELAVSSAAVGNSSCRDEIAAKLAPAREAVNIASASVAKKMEVHTGLPKIPRDQALADFRVQVDFNLTSPMEVISMYGLLLEGMVADLTRIVNRLVTDSRSAHLSCALFAALSHKVAVGRQMVIVSCIISRDDWKGQMSPMAHVLLVSNSGAQSGQARAVMNSGADDHTTAFASVCGEADAVLMQLERALQMSQRNVEEVLMGLQCPAWISAMQTWLGALNGYLAYLLCHLSGAVGPVDKAEVNGGQDGGLCQQADFSEVESELLTDLAELTNEEHVSKAWLPPTAAALCLSPLDVSPSQCAVEGQT